MSGEETSLLDGLLALETLDFLAAIRDYPSDLYDALIAERMPHDLKLFSVKYLDTRFTLPFNVMHHDFLSVNVAPWTERKRRTLTADAAPREGAKSTIKSWAAPIKDIVEGRELYICFISTTSELANDLATDIFNTFLHPELHEDLHRDYGPFRVVGTKTDFIVYVPGGDARGVRCKSFSFLGTIRGTKHCGVRPTKVIIDDGEHPERVKSDSQRAKTMEFLTKDILKAGSYYTWYCVVGTVLHADSMLARLLAAPQWKGTKYKSMIKWPIRKDLWEQCRIIWCNVDNPNNIEDARAFFEANREEMERGAKVLWPEREGLFELYEYIWGEGRVAFNSEKQNEPRDEALQIYDTEKHARCQVDWDRQAVTAANGRVIAFAHLRFAVWHDPKPTDAKRGDDAAFAVVCEEKVPRSSRAYRFVIYVYMDQIGPDKQVEEMWSIFDMLSGQDVVFGFESNQESTMYSDKSFRGDIEKRLEEGKPANLEVRGEPSTTNKNTRMARLKRDCDNGWLQFAQPYGTDQANQFAKLDSQFAQFPTASHDDGMDAVERADWLLDDTVGGQGVWGL